MHREAIFLRANKNQVVPGAKPYRNRDDDGYAGGYQLRQPFEVRRHGRAWRTFARDNQPFRSFQHERDANLRTEAPHVGYGVAAYTIRRRGKPAIVLLDITAATCGERGEYRAATVGSFLLLDEGQRDCSSNGWPMRANE